ncbi:kinase-like protein [Marasmius fiardii PR-910]|nr:kinase-like protein [Marasmius fiardii PR-910]
MSTVRNFDELRSSLFSSTSLKALQADLEITEAWTASSVVDWLQEEIQSSTHNQLYRKRCTKCLNTLVKKYHVFPTSFFRVSVRQDGDYPLGGGGFAVHIYKGFVGSQVVCLKVLRVHTQTDEKRRKKMVENFYQEALIWTQLSHPNVLQLLGVNTALFNTDFCLVSPWMVNGDINAFLEKNPNHDRLRSIQEIAAGLRYLHSRSPKIVHGDIRGANILVDEDFSCRLADFGLSMEASGTTLIETSTGGMKGSVRWMAPEGFETSTERDSKEDRSSRDIYAYACTIFEIMTGRPHSKRWFNKELNRLRKEVRSLRKKTKKWENAPLHPVHVEYRQKK